MGQGNSSWRRPVFGGKGEQPKTSNVSDPATPRIMEALNGIEEIRKICQVPSMSLGVLHQGSVLWTNGIGALDPRLEAENPPNNETLYTLCSISKVFVSACIGILVDEGKMDWSNTVGSHLHDFKPNGDQRVTTEATFNDFLRHSGGLSNPVSTILAQGGKVLVPQRDFIELVNDAPTEVGGQPCFNRGFHYSNIAYGLMTIVIERLSGISFAEFLQKRVLDPLGMRNTAVFKVRVAENSSNVAHAFAQLDDGTWSFLDHEWTSEDNSPVLGMVGIRSSVKDMMIFGAAVMEAWLDDVDLKDFGILGDSGASNNPLKQMGAILNGHYWGRPHNDPFQNPSAYHLGWLRATMPTCMVSWGSWNSVLEKNATPQNKELRDSCILGRDSGTRLLYKSVGIGFCGTGSITLFPETRSAVVVFSNSLNCADASDLAASVLIQALFDLKPPVDFLPVARRERELRKAQFAQVMRDLDHHRDISSPESDHADYVGRYRGLGIDLLVRKRDKDGQLQLCLNRREDCVWPLEHHNVDQYSYWPKTRDDWLRGGWLDWDYYMVGILNFKRQAGSGAVDGLTLVWEKGADAFLFRKM
ncbi:hypothetical protein OQA88_1441 [Cercophora sp. LCS_1]